MKTHIGKLVCVPEEGRWTPQGIVVGSEYLSVLVRKWDNSNWVIYFTDDYFSFFINDFSIFLKSKRHIYGLPFPT